MHFEKDKWSAHEYDLENLLVDFLDNAGNLDDIKSRMSAFETSSPSWSLIRENFPWL